MNTIRKIVLWDFIQILKQREDLNLPAKVRIYVNEYVHKLTKIATRNYTYYKGRHFGELIEGLIRKGELEDVPCNLCGSSHSRRVGEKRGFTVVECSQCGLRFTNPRPNQTARKILYSRRYYFDYRVWLGQRIQSDSTIQEGLLAEQQLAQILMYKKEGKFLDVGCSTGNLLSAAGKKGFDCVGIEPNTWACKFAIEKKDLKIINEELRSASLKDGTFDVVSYMEVIEHIPDPLAELREIKRIMKNDGILILSTPNFGCQESQTRAMGWKHNKPWEHIYLFDYPHLREILRMAGFEIVDFKTELSDGVGYPGGLLVIARKMGFGFRKKNPKILLVRKGAMGDVLLTTPVIRALKEKYPRSSIVFRTDWPEILQHNPYVDKVITDDDYEAYDVIHNLKYELYPEMALVDAYARIARIAVNNRRLEFYVTNEEVRDTSDLLDSLQITKGEKVAIIHTLAGERMKSWSPEKYQEVADYLITNHYRVITVGASTDSVELNGAHNLIGDASIRRLAGIMRRADLFFGLDSFPMHLANAYGVPSIVLFGSTDPQKVICRNEIIHIVQSDEKCLGCRHDTTPDRWFENVSCRRDDLSCMTNISSKQAIEVINSFILHGRHNDRQCTPRIACGPV